MSETLPPPPSSLPTLLASDTLVMPSGVLFGRMFFAGGSHPAAWDRFRSFGPLSHMRFDHHPPPQRFHPERAISYVAPALARGRANDPFETCILETFAGTHTIDARAFSPWFALWAATRPVTLLDVVDSPWIVRARGNAAISSGRRGMSRKWARSIYRAYDSIDGIYYEASSLPSARSVALFERARTALPTSHKLALPLTHPGFVGALRRIAGAYDYDLVL